jgi:acyl carrier protein
VVSDGVLYAACVASGDAQAAEWAAGYFEHSLASAIGEASGVLLAGPALEQRVADYALRIGDIEQQLAGADEMLDPLIARTAPRLRAESLPNATATVAQPRASTAPVARAGPRSRAELENFVLDWLASELKLARTSINAQASFFDYGLDSVTAVLLAVAIEERFGCEVEPESLYQRPQIDAFLADLARSA